jgi:formiminotetrahydrofolate cyclodeaminase
MLIDLSLGDFLDETASDSPAPGGGSVSALAGSLGAALTLMVAKLSAEGDAALARVGAQGDELLAALKSRIDEDTAAFNAVMNAFKLPKATPEERAARTIAIQEKTKEAAALPMDVAELCVKALALSCEALRLGKAGTASDAAVAGRVAYAGMWGAVYNVRINLSSIKDEGFTSATRDRIRAVLAAGEAQLAALTALADGKIRA